MNWLVGIRVDFYKTLLKIGEYGAEAGYQTVKFLIFKKSNYLPIFFH
jgi:hypothetical protein